MTGPKPGVINRKEALQRLLDQSSLPVWPLPDQQEQQITQARRNLERQELLASGDKDVASPTLVQLLKLLVQKRMKLGKQGLQPSTPQEP